MLIVGTAKEKQSDLHTLLCQLCIQLASLWTFMMGYVFSGKIIFFLCIYWWWCVRWAAAWTTEGPAHVIVPSQVQQAGNCSAVRSHEKTREAHLWCAECLGEWMNKLELLSSANEVCFHLQQTLFIFGYKILSLLEARNSIKPPAGQCCIFPLNYFLINKTNCHIELTAHA